MATLMHTGAHDLDVQENTHGSIHLKIKENYATVYSPKM